MEMKMDIENSSNQSKHIAKNTYETKQRKQLSTLLKNLKKTPKSNHNCGIVFSDDQILSFGNSNKYKVQDLVNKEEKNSPMIYYYIKKFSQLYFEKCEYMAQNIENNINMYSISNKMCENIIKEFVSIVQELNMPNNPLESKLSKEETQKAVQDIKLYLLVFSFIKIFYVCADDKNKIMEIREAIYKYGLDIDYNEFDIYSRNDLKFNDVNEEEIFTNFFDACSKKVFFCLRNCDFEHLAILFDNCEKQLLANYEISEKTYLRQNREFASIFNMLRSFFYEYNQSLLKNDFNDENIEILRKNKYKLGNMVFSTLKEIERETAQFPNDSKSRVISLINFIHTIMTFIIDPSNTIREVENLCEIILMSVYYGLGEIDLNLEMNFYLNHREINNLQDLLLVNLIGKHPFEFYSEATSYLPLWVNFSIMDILYDLNLLPIEKNLDKSLRDKQYLTFIEYLTLLEVPLKDFLNYTSLFDIEKENRKIYYVLLEKFATKYVIKELNKHSEYKLSQKSNESLNQEYLMYKTNFVENLKNVFLQLKLLKSTAFIIKSLSLICFNSFLEILEIKLAIEFLLLSFCDDTRFEAKKENYLEKVFHHVLINGLDNNFNEILELPDFIFNVYPNLDFLKKLVNFYLSLRISITDDLDFVHVKNLNETEKIFASQFFEYCFINKKCPRIMWIYTLKLFQQIDLKNYDNLLYIKYQDYRMCLSNNAIYEYFYEPLLEIQKAFPRCYLKFNPLSLPNEDINEYFTEEVYRNIFDSLEEFIHDKQSFTYSGI